MDLTEENNECRENTEPEVDEVERSTRLRFHRGDELDDLDTSLILRTGNGGHVFEMDAATQRDAFGQEMMIRSGDHLLGVNNVSVQDWNHSLVVAILSHLLTSTEFSILIGRPGTEMAILEIKAITAFSSRGGFSELLRSVNIVRGRLLPPIGCFAYQGASLCWIKHIYSNLYLKCGRNGKIKMKNLNNISNKKFQFLRHTFSGTQGRSPEFVFVCVLEPACSQYRRHAVCQLNIRKVGLVPDAIDKYFTAREMTKADSRFFSLHETLKNQFCIQSIVNKGYFLTGSTRNPVLSVSECPSALTFPGSAPDAAFSIIHNVG